jgi:hypothetical protein
MAIYKIQISAYAGLVGCDSPDEIPDNVATRLLNGDAAILKFEEISPDTLFALLQAASAPGSADSSTIGVDANPTSAAGRTKTSAAT